MKRIVQKIIGNIYINEAMKVKSRIGIKRILMFVPAIMLLLSMLVMMFVLKADYLREQENNVLDYYGKIAAMNMVHTESLLEGVQAEVLVAAHMISENEQNRDVLWDDPKYFNLGSDKELLISGNQILYGNEECQKNFADALRETAKTGKGVIAAPQVFEDGVYRFAVTSFIKGENGEDDGVLLMAYPVSVFEKRALGVSPSRFARVCVFWNDILMDNCTGNKKLTDGECTQAAGLLSVAKVGQRTFTADSGEEYMVGAHEMEVPGIWFVCYAPLSDIQRDATDSIIRLQWFLFSAIIIIIALVIYDTFKLIREREKLSLFRRKFDIAVKQQGRAVFEYNEKLNSLRFLSKSKRIKLPDADDKAPLSLFIGAVAPEDKRIARSAIEELQKVGYSETTVKMKSSSDGDIYRWFHITCTRLTESGLGSDHYVGIMEDIDERERERRQLRHKATTDPLTGLLNRSEIQRMVENRLVELNGENTAAFIIFDIDNFKSVNDDCGHNVGDHVLRAFSESLKSTFRMDDIIGRLGGDEFAVYMGFLSEMDIVERRLTELSERFREGSRGLCESEGFSFSAGFVSAQMGEGFESLYSRADAAMYRAKSDGKGGFACGEEKCTYTE